MNVVIPTEARLLFSQGRVVCPYFTYERVWKRYLEVFESVTLLTRLQPQDHPTAGPVEGPGVAHLAIPYFLGPWQYVRQRGAIRRFLREHLPEDSAYILHLPGTVGGEVWSLLKARGIPYAMEVLGDPYDSLAPGANRHLLRPLLRQIIPRRLRLQAQGAFAAYYVTKRALQARYPCPGQSFAASDVELPESKIRPEPRTFTDLPNRRARIIIVGSYNQLYKAPDILIRAVGECLKQGLNLELELVGDAGLQDFLMNLARQVGAGDRVHFVGRVAGGSGVMEKLDQADLFVLPSYQEGLPRAMVEAMARALPCIGSTVGGFPELLASEDMVPPGNVAALASKIREFLTQPGRMAAASARNLRTSHDYRDSVLKVIRREFLTCVRQHTENWLKGRGRQVASAS